MKHGAIIARKAASLPVNYEAAKLALVACERLDECKAWADQAGALASYYAQSRDKDLEEKAMRIRLRAQRRIGELLLQMDGKTPRAKKGYIQAGGRSPRTTAARDVGLSKTQARANCRLAQIPTVVAETQIEASPPPTPAKLLAIAPKDEKFAPNRFSGGAAYALLARDTHGLMYFSYFCQKHPAVPLANELTAAEAARCSRHAAEIQRWLTDFARSLKRLAPLTLINKES